VRNGLRGTHLGSTVDDVGSWLSGNEYEARAIESKVGEYDSQTGVFQYKIVDEDSSM
jgi:hypothetical protein